MRTIAIAGVSGFVGSALAEDLARDHHVVGLSRTAREGGGIEWRQCDLFSMPELERALEGCDAAVYLVHSMLPSARLTQASFEDLDLILADNFARAAQKAGVHQVVYLGGLVPNDEDPGRLSPHLKSRLEVERALAARVPLASLRASMVVGEGGSSLHIMTTLVKRLPAMITPRWTESATQPIALRDVVRAARRCLEEPERFQGAFDIGGPDVMSYREMMERTAKVLGVRRPMIPFPGFTPNLSTLWVSMITGMPRALVGPLVKSLEHPMTVDDNPLQAWLVKDALTFEDSLREALRGSERPRLASRRAYRREHRPLRRVRSVQRLPRPEDTDARWVAEEYLRWLPGKWPLWIRATREGADVTFRMLGVPLLTLRLDEARSNDGRAIFRIVGGNLADTRSSDDGRLVFRATPDGESFLAAIHDFVPRLPWYVYRYTQAHAHAFVMWSYRRHLRELARTRPSARTSREILTRLDATP